MKNLVFSLMIIAAGLIVFLPNAEAQSDPAILLRIATAAQNQIADQITDDSPDDVKALFQQGTDSVNALKEAVNAGDMDSAKQHFLSSMRIFKQISLALTNSQTIELKTAPQKDMQDLTNELLRMQQYLTNLKTLAEKHNILIDFTSVDGMVEKAKQLIREENYDDANQLIDEIKKQIAGLDKELRDKTAEQSLNRARAYAHQYIEQLDRIIQSAKNQNVSSDIIERLESARQRLSSASSSQEIINEIRHIISLKEQFELTKNDRLESRVIQIEKIITNLSQDERVDQESLQGPRETLTMIKQKIREGNADEANDLLRDLLETVKQIQKSIS